MIVTGKDDRESPPSVALVTLPLSSFRDDDISRDIIETDEEAVNPPKIPPSLLERKRYWMENRAERLKQIRAQMASEEVLILRAPEEDLVEEIVEEISEEIIDEEVEDHEHEEGVEVEEIYLS